MTDTHRESAHTAHSHRRYPRTTRRAVLGVAAVAALSAAATGLNHLRSAGGPAGSAPGPDSAGSVRSATAAQPATSRSAAGTHPTTSRSASPSAPATTKVAAGGPVPFEAGKVMLGAYLALSGKTLAQSVALREQQLGRGERIVHLFYDWMDTLPASIAGLPSDAFPMVSWAGTYYADILDGSSDRLIAATARRLAQSKRPTLLRWGWEMNGNWFDWGGAENGHNPGGYAACWRRLHKIFQQEGAHNVSWVWSLNCNSAPDNSANRFQAYYPGDKYVDWVGISGYDFGGETPQALYDPVYNTYAGAKPIFITECGSVDHGGSTKADWITKFAAYVGKRPAIGAVTWFDTDTHKGSPERWRIDTDARSLAAYKAMARSPRFSG